MNNDMFKNYYIFYKSRTGNVWKHKKLQKNDSTSCNRGADIMSN